MLRICALNESGSDTDSESETENVVSREVQEEHLLSLYNDGLKYLVSNEKKRAKKNFLEITNNEFFLSENGCSEQIQKSLRYNVHKNLAECYLGEGELELAKDQLLNASEIDDSDVSLWFKIAATAVKLENLYLCRTALEEGLRCSPNHWPCLENLITVTFKLFDFVGCLGYCALALKRDSHNEKAILYKSKVYNEMPFLQDVYNDNKFVVVKTERETFSYLPPKLPKQKRVSVKLKKLSWVGVSESLKEIHQTYYGTEFIDNPVDTVKMIEDLKNRTVEEQEAVIKVSVQNLVENMIDIVEDREAIDSQTEEVVEFVLDNILEGVCAALEEEEKTESEKISGDIIKELLNGLDYENGNKKKKSVIIAAPAPKKKHFSIFDEIPEELIEKRRSARGRQQVNKFESQPSSDTSNDFVQIFTPKELLESFLPKTLKLGRDKSPKLKLPIKPPQEKVQTAKKQLFPVQTDTDFHKPVEWIGEEEEARQVEHFLTIHEGKSVLAIMRLYLEYMFGLNPNMPWPKELGPLYGRVYITWRRHLQEDLLERDPEDPLTKEFLRYMILGNECILSKYLAASKERENEVVDDEMNEDSDVFEDDIPEDEQKEIDIDLVQLTFLIEALPVDLAIRIQSAKFHFYSLTQREEEAAIESKYLEQLYKDCPGVTVTHPVEDYTVATKQYLETYLSDLTKNKELEELYKYFDEKRYGDIVKLLLETLEKPGLVTPKDKDGGKAPDREGQIDILIESLYKIGDYEQCLKWTESALNTQFKAVTHDPETNESVVPTKSDWEVLDAYLATIDCCLQSLEKNPEKTKETFGGMSVGNGARLASNIIKILVFQIDDTNSQAEMCYQSALPWILLHKLITWQEQFVKTPEKPKSPDDEDEENLVDLDAPMKGSLNLLCSAHDYLGQKSACGLQKGRLLNYIVDVFVPILTATDLPGYSDQLKTNLEQAIYCLYAHPSKKKTVKHLADHNVSQIGLSWERSLVLYKYVLPRKIPEHDDIKIMSVYDDTANLLKRIVALVPDGVNVEKRRSAAADYISGKTNRIKGISHLEKLPQEAGDLFYLLADYNFKNSDFEAAIKNYTIDLTFNKNRFDTWAALALSQASQMDTKLNSCKQIVHAQMLEEIGAVAMCFKECLKINGSNYNLWIEFGNFSYYIHSYISRTIKNDSENLNMDLFEKLETMKEEFLKLTESNYGKTLEIIEKEGISANDVDERWLIHFMKGKIKEKSNVSFLECLECYKVSMEFHRQNKVVVPKRISYSNPQLFALEAMEVYYRVHASILKYLLKFEKNNKEVDEDVCEKLFYYLKDFQLDPMYNTFSTTKKEDRFMGNKKRPATDPLGGDGAPAAKVARDDETSTNIMRDVLEVVDTMIEDIEEINDKTKYKTANLANIAIKGLEDIVQHFSHHFKALHRMAHYYSTSKANKSVAKVKQLLLNESIGKSFLGLFGERKQNNIFNGVWRIPVTEIDRPGSFATHCARSLTLLLETLRDTNEINFLMEIAVQLRKPPNEENKFLHESDRQEVVTQANTYLLTATKNVIKSANIESERTKPTVLLDIHKVYIKLQRLWPGKEKELMLSMREFYAQIKDKEKDKVTIDEVLRFCAGETNRQRIQMNPRSTATFSSTTTSTTSSNVGIKQNVQAASAGRQQQPQQQQSNAALLQQYSQLSQMLADQQSMVQYQQLIAMSSALPGMSTADIAAMCGLNLTSGFGGLSASDLSAYTAQLSSMSSSQLAQLGLTSAHLTQLAQLAAITSGSNQQDYMRQMMSGASSKPTTTPTTSMSGAMGTSPATGAAASSKMAPGVSKMAVPIKQTAKFKAKPQSIPTVKKMVQKAVANVTGSPGTNLAKVGTSLTSVAQKLNSSGVTLTQPKQTTPKPNQGKPPQQSNIGKPRTSLPTPGQGSKMSIPTPSTKPLTTQQMLQALKNGTSPNISKPGQAQAASNKPGQAQTATKPSPSLAKPPQAHSASKAPQAHMGTKPAQAQAGAKPPQAHAAQPARLSQKFPHLSITNIDLLKAQPGQPTSQNCIPMATPKASGSSGLPRQGAIPKPQNQTIPKPQTAKGAKAVPTKLTALQAKQAAMKKNVAAQNTSQPGSSPSTPSPTASFKANKAVDAKSQLAMFKQNLIKNLGVKPAAVKQTKAAAAKSGAIPKPGAGAIPKPGTSGIPKPGGASAPKPQPKKQQVKPKPKPPGGDQEIICIDID